MRAFANGVDLGSRMVVGVRDGEFRHHIDP